SEIHQQADLLRSPFSNLANDDSTTAVPFQHDRTRSRVQDIADVINPGSKGHLTHGSPVLAQAWKVRRDDDVTGALKQRDEFVPAPGPMPRTVHHHIGTHDLPRERESSRRFHFIQNGLPPLGSETVLVQAERTDLGFESRSR